MISERYGLDYICPVFRDTLYKKLCFSELIVRSFLFFRTLPGKNAKPVMATSEHKILCLVCLEKRRLAFQFRVLYYILEEKQPILTFFSEAAHLSAAC